MSTTYYSLWDLQCNRRMGTGLNTTSLKALKEDFISYISVDFDEEDGEKEYRALSMQELAEMKDFLIETSKTKFEEED